MLRGRVLDWFVIVEVGSTVYQRVCVLARGSWLYKESLLSKQREEEEKMTSSQSHRRWCPGDTVIEK